MPLYFKYFSVYFIRINILSYVIREQLPASVNLSLIQCFLSILWIPVLSIGPEIIFVHSELWYLSVITMILIHWGKNHKDNQMRLSIISTMNMMSTLFQHVALMKIHSRNLGQVLLPERAVYLQNAHRHWVCICIYFGYEETKGQVETLTRLYGGLFSFGLSPDLLFVFSHCLSSGCYNKFLRVGDL